MEDDCFPMDVLQGTPDEIVDYYDKNVIVHHELLDRVVDELDRRANHRLVQRLVLLVGASGVGKSAVLELLVNRRQARREHSKTDKRKSGRAAIRHEVIAPEKGAFDFAEIYREGMKAMGIPLIGASLPMRSMVVNGVARDVADMRNPSRNPTPLGLRERFENAVEYDELRMMCLDEAINMFKVGKPRTEKQRLSLLKDQGDILKSFSNRNQLSVVVSGAYDFLDLANASAQLARRSLIVHFRRYTATEADMMAFTRAVFSLIGRLPKQFHCLDPKELVKELFFVSLGCIGIVKSLLCTALSCALYSNVLLTADLLRTVYYPRETLLKMKAEAETGEALVKALTEAEAMHWLPKVGQNAEPAKPNGMRALKPGETRPDYRAGAAESW